MCPFCICFADVSNKSKAGIAVYVYAFESSRFTLSNGIGYVTATGLEPTTTYFVSGIGYYDYYICLLYIIIYDYYI